MVLSSGTVVLQRKMSIFALRLLNVQRYLLRDAGPEVRSELRTSWYDQMYVDSNTFYKLQTPFCG